MKVINKMAKLVKEIKALDKRYFQLDEEKHRILSSVFKTLIYKNKLKRINIEIKVCCRKRSELTESLFELVRNL